MPAADATSGRAHRRPRRAPGGSGGRSRGVRRHPVRVRVAALVIAVTAFGLGAGTGGGVLPDGGAGDAVVGAWGAVTGAGRDDASSDEGSRDATRTGTSGVDALVDAVVGEVDSLPVEEVGVDASVTSAQVLVPQLGSGLTSLSLGGGPTESDLAAGLLSLDVPRSASGDLTVVPGSQAPPAALPGTDPVVRTIRVEVEDGLDVDAGLFAYTVMQTLNDPRGWGADGSMVFARTDADDAELRVVLASPALVDDMCAPLETVGKVSCGIKGHAVLNYLRWVDGSSAWDGDKVSYRHYLVNHEVGHILGHHHEYCGGAGQVAPLMQQQTGPMAPCTPNPWPFPPG